jgi:hypothetical protein
MFSKPKSLIASAFPKGVEYYARLKERALASYYGNKHASAVFADIYQRNLWNNSESRSGRCATIEATAAVREQLPLLLSKYDVQTMLDAPCGDFNWIQHATLELDRYIGADIVAELIEKNSTPGPVETLWCWISPKTRSPRWT